MTRQTSEQELFRVKTKYTINIFQGSCQLYISLIGKIKRRDIVCAANTLPLLNVNGHHNLHQNPQCHYIDTDTTEMKYAPCRDHEASQGDARARCSRMDQRRLQPCRQRPCNGLATAATRLWANQIGYAHRSFHVLLLMQ